MRFEHIIQLSGSLYYQRITKLFPRVAWAQVESTFLADFNVEPPCLHGWGMAM